MNETMEEQVVLVNTLDEAQGTMEKMAAHREGVLHRAFSVFILNSRGELLLQQRAHHKYHSGGLWTNTCCSHRARSLCFALRIVAFTVSSSKTKSQFHYRFARKFSDSKFFSNNCIGSRNVLYFI